MEKSRVETTNNEGSTLYFPAMTSGWTRQGKSQHISEINRVSIDRTFIAFTPEPDAVAIKIKNKIWTLHYRLHALRTPITAYRKAITDLRLGENFATSVLKKHPALGFASYLQFFSGPRLPSFLSQPRSVIPILPHSFSMLL